MENQSLNPVWLILYVLYVWLELQVEPEISSFSLLPTVLSSQALHRNINGYFTNNTLQVTHVESSLRLWKWQMTFRTEVDLFKRLKIDTEQEHDAATDRCPNRLKFHSHKLNMSEG